MHSTQNLIGRKLTHIDIDQDNDEMLLTCEDGSQFKLYHEQDCCEYVRIDDIEGDASLLLNKQIINVFTEIDHEMPEPVDYSCTNTKFKFLVDDATLIVKWVGTSNGYYSEHVDFRQIK